MQTDPLVKAQTSLVVKGCSLPDHPPPHFHLERPVGTELGRYTWPKLEPMKGSPELTGSVRKDLGAYLERYGKKIERKIESVYSTQ